MPFHIAHGGSVCSLTLPTVPDILEWTLQMGLLSIVFKGFNLAQGSQIYL